MLGGTSDNAAMRARIRPGDDPAAVADGAARIRAGELVAFPTETVYGLGANALDPLAVARIFEVKERPSFDPLIVHLADPSELRRHALEADLRDPRVASLVKSFWPGPLTLVLRKRPTIPDIVTAGLFTVGLRVPDHPVALQLLREAGVPIAAPSANRFGRLSPTRAEHVGRQLGDRIGLILDGGASRIGVESTVLFLSGGRAVLLRPGGLPVEDIEALVGSVARAAAASPDGTGRRVEPVAAAAQSPGQLLSHYAPVAPLAVVPPAVAVEVRAGERVGLLAASEAGRRQAAAAGGPFAAVEVPSPDGNLLRLAAGLFEALHRLDGADLDRIVAQPVADAGLGRAIMDRLRRAAAAGPSSGGSDHPKR
jgi:L-threonylcarbamoyladenylate synthase